MWASAVASIARIRAVTSPSVVSPPKTAFGHDEAEAAAKPAKKKAAATKKPAAKKAKK